MHSPPRLPENEHGRFFARALRYSGSVFGSHLSIAGGLHNALLAAETLGLDTVQVFTSN